MCRTEFDPDVSPYLSFSMIIVPTNTPGALHDPVLRSVHALGTILIDPPEAPGVRFALGYNIIRDPAVLGIHSGHCEVRYENVRVPYDNLLGPRGHGFIIAQVWRHGSWTTHTTRLIQLCPAVA